MLCLVVSVSADTPWLSDWDHRREITINSSQIDSDLTHFPITLFLGSSVGEGSGDVSSIFDEVGNNSQKIAVTQGNGTTQLCCEIETWNATSKEAVLHVSRDAWNISSSVNTSIYIYYDNTQDNNTGYIGAIGTTAGETVWDANFKAVYHMVDATISTVLDSTNNNNDGTKKGANEPVGATGKVGQGQLFDDGEISTSGAYNDNGYTISFCSYPTDIISSLYVAAGNADIRAVILGYQDNNFNIYNKGYPTGTAGDTQVAATINTWQHIVYGSDGTDVLAYKDGANVIDVTANLNTNEMDEFSIGRHPLGTHPYAGTLDEVRISNTLRNAAWIKATYNGLWDTLLTWGTEQSFTATPTAQFTATPTIGAPPLTVQFNDTSTATPTSWFWTFGDGNTSTLQNPENTYTSTGLYTVSLKATSAQGNDTETKTDYIDVGDPPTAAFTANITMGAVPLPVAFTDNSTESPTNWSWTFGGGKTSTLQNPENTYTGPDNYTVSLTATNKYGSSSPLTKTDYIYAYEIFPFPGWIYAPTDPDSDGLYEDINGNGRWDYNDPQEFAKHVTWAANIQPLFAFDFAGDGGISFCDVNALWRMYG